MPPAEGLATHGESESTRSRKAAGNAIRQEGVQAWYRAAKVFFLRVPTWWCGGEGNIPASIKRDGGGPCVVVDPMHVHKVSRARTGRARVRPQVALWAAERSLRTYVSDERTREV